MTTLHRKPSFRRILAGTLAFLLLVGLTSIGHARQKQISPEKAQMIGYVEDFLMNNFRDVTMRKSLEWSDVRTDDKGNRTIRYRFEALIWDKDRKTLCWDFTFNPDGKYVGYQKVEVAEAEKPDPTTQEGIQKLVEKFFSQNYRDITARETIDWGELEIGRAHV